MEHKVAGFISLDKPAGFTSHDCVALVRRALKLRQVGHGGTLDPMATGVLPIAIGRATRLLSFIASNKAYRGTIRFGQTSTTDDAAGEITIVQAYPAISETLVAALVPQFSGLISQVPPRYSAIRHEGQRFYDLARQGLDLMPPQRQVEIQSITLTDWRPGEFPEVDVEIVCGEGTYIRAIARDWGAALGCGGLLAQLRRLQSGPFVLDNSVPLAEFTDNPAAYLQPPAIAFPAWPQVQLPSDVVWRWQCGQSLPADLLKLELSDHRYTVWDGEHKFQGLGEVAEGSLRPLRVWEVQQ